MNNYNHFTVSTVAFVHAQTNAQMHTYIHRAAEIQLYMFTMHSRTSTHSINEDESFNKETSI